MFGHSSAAAYASGGNSVNVLINSGSCHDCRAEEQESVAGVMARGMAMGGMAVARSGMMSAGMASGGMAVARSGMMGGGMAMACSGGMAIGGMAAGGMAMARSGGMMGHEAVGGYGYGGGMVMGGYGYRGGYYGGYRGGVRARGVVMPGVVVGGSWYAGWYGFRAHWAEYFDWMDYDIYESWYQWQMMLRALPYGIEMRQQRSMLEGILRRSRADMAGAEMESLVDRILDSNRQIGAGSDGRVSEVTETSTTTTTTTVTQQQRYEAANEFLAKLQETGGMGISLEQAREVSNAIRSGEKDDLVKTHIEMKAAADRRAIETPPQQAYIEAPPTRAPTPVPTPMQQHTTRIVQQDFAEQQHHPAQRPSAPAPTPMRAPSQQRVTGTVQQEFAVQQQLRTQVPPEPSQIPAQQYQEPPAQQSMPTPPQPWLQPSPAPAQTPVQHLTAMPTHQYMDGTSPHVQQNTHNAAASNQAQAGASRTTTTTTTTTQHSQQTMMGMVSGMQALRVHPGQQQPLYAQRPAQQYTAPPQSPHMLSTPPQQNLQSAPAQGQIAYASGQSTLPPQSPPLQSAYNQAQQQPVVLSQQAPTLRPHQAPSAFQQAVSSPAPPGLQMAQQHLPWQQPQQVLQLMNASTFQPQTMPQTPPQQSLPALSYQMQQSSQQTPMAVTPQPQQMNTGVQQHLQQQALIRQAPQQVYRQSTPSIMQPTPISPPAAQATQQLAQWQGQQLQARPAQASKVVQFPGSQQMLFPAPSHQGQQPFSSAMIPSRTTQGGQ